MLRSALLTLLLASGLGFASRPTLAEPPAPAAETLRLERALAGLASPLRGERQDAQRALIALLPGARPAVAQAWAEGDETLRSALVDVLAADASPAMLGLLIEAWRTGGESLASRARSGLLVDPDATRRALEAYRAAPVPAGDERRPVASIDAMLERDLVERTFIARKSRSGGTGFYRGQYEALLPWRELALEVCLHILTDRAMRLPGTASAGGYRFLRPLGQVIDVWEVRGMALNAILDLARPTDIEIVRHLDEYKIELEQREAGYGDFDGDVERERLLDELLATLYRLAPRRYGPDLKARVTDLENSAMFSRRDRTAAAQLALRAGWYEQAIQLYSRQLRSSQSPASDHYNLACAYACWALEPGAQDPAKLKRTALLHLEQAVERSWTDIAWMDQDRDLDPIRDTPTYRALRKRILDLLQIPDPTAPPAAPSPPPKVPAPGADDGSTPRPPR